MASYENSNSLLAPKGQGSVGRLIGIVSFDERLPLWNEKVNKHQGLPLEGWRKHDP